MKAPALFVAGVVVGVVMTHTGVAQEAAPRAHHVGSPSELRRDAVTTRRHWAS